MRTRKEATNYGLGQDPCVAATSVDKRADQLTTDISRSQSWPQTLGVPVRSHPLASTGVYTLDKCTPGPYPQGDCRRGRVHEKNNSESRALQTKISREDMKQTKTAGSASAFLPTRIWSQAILAAFRSTSWVRIESHHSLPSRI